MNAGDIRGHWFDSMAFLQVVMSVFIPDSTLHQRVWKLEWEREIPGSYIPRIFVHDNCSFDDNPSL